MFNLFRMDLRRLLRSRGFYIVLSVAAGFTLLVILLSATMADPATLDSMQASGAEISEYDRQESAAIREMSQLALAYECLSSGILLVMTGIGVTLFVHSDFSSGAIKNVLFAGRRRRDYVLSKALLAGVYSGLLVGACLLIALAAPPLFGLTPAADSPLAIARYAFWLWLPHWAFGLMALAAVLLTRGSTAGILLSVASGSGMTAALLQKLCVLLGWPPLEEALLSMVVYNRCVPHAGTPQKAMALACAAGWGLAYTAASLLLMEKRDL